MDEIENVSLIFTGEYRPVGLATRTPEQLDRLRFLFLPQYMKKGNEELRRTQIPAEACIRDYALRKARLESAKESAMQNFFDFVGAAEMSWEAHVWLLDYEYSRGSRLTMWIQYAL